MLSCMCIPLIAVRKVQLTMNSEEEDYKSRIPINAAHIFAIT